VVEKLVFGLEQCNELLIILIGLPAMKCSRRVSYPVAARWNRTSTADTIMEEDCDE
jgi:hypothetical protein